MRSSGTFLLLYSHGLYILTPPFRQGTAIPKHRETDCREYPILKRAFLLTVVLPSLLLCSGCVSSGVFEKKVAAADGLKSELQDLRTKQEALETENSALQDRLKKLSDDLSRVSDQRDRIEADRRALDRILKSKPDSASKALGDQREKTFALERESTTLQERLAKQDEDREGNVKAVSKTYENLMQAMKEEIAQGQVTILERRGKVTVDVAEEVLFASGEADIKPEGLLFLRRAFPILKEAEDRLIRVESRTDAFRAGGYPAKQQAIHWEFSAARAVQVARHLEQLGIDTALLSAAACGEDRSAADIGAPEGRTKNRSISIIVQPKD